MKGMKHKILRLSALGLLAVFTSQVYASGYKLEFMSASILADAGEAAAAEDAGTNWYNAAGLVYLPQQLVMSAIDLYEPTKFSGTATTPSPFGPAFSSVATGTAHSYSNSVLPAIHYSLPFKDRYAVGLSIVPSWGFTEDYGKSFSLVRYDLYRIYTKTIDVSPSVAMKLNNQWSVGLGPDFDYFSVLSSNAVRTQGPAAFGGTTGDSESRYSAEQWSKGFHAGVMFRLDDATRFGLNYRSKIVLHLDGYSDFALSNGPSFETNEFKLRVVQPATTTFSAYHDLNQRWAILGTIAYDQWSLVQSYNANNYIQPPTAGNPSGLINVSVPQKMNNTFDYSIGTHFKLNDQWMLRGSIKYEPTPTKTLFRDINFPDADKLGFQIGARYQVSKKMAIDMLYGHVFTRTAPINATNPITLAKVQGNSRTSIDLLGAQLVWNI